MSESPVDPTDSTYRSFLLRIWCSKDDTGLVAWRGEIESIQHGERRRFETLAEVLDFLQDQTAGPDRPNEVHDEATGGQQ